MKKYIFLLFFIFLTSVSAEDKTRIYGDYAFGMTRDEIKTNPEVYECSDEFEKGALCLDGEKFAGEGVEIGFRLLNDKLVTVVLASDFSEENYLKFMGALNSKFQLSTIESGNEKIDIIEQTKNYNEAQYLKNITDFEQTAMSAGEIKYSFLEREEFKKLIKSSENTAEMILKSDIDTRLVEYSIIEMDDQSTISVIQFSAPKRSFSLLTQEGAKEHEDF